MTPVRTALALAAALALLLGSCGSDDDADSQGSSSEAETAAEAPVPSADPKAAAAAAARCRQGGPPPAGEPPPGMEDAPLASAPGSFGASAVGFDPAEQAGRDLLVEGSYLGSVVFVAGAGGDLLVPRVEAAAEQAGFGPTEQSAEGVEGIILSELGEEASQYSTSAGCYALTVITPNPGIARNIARHYIRQGSR